MCNIIIIILQQIVGAFTVPTHSVAPMGYSTEKANQLFQVEYTGTKASFPKNIVCIGSTLPSSCLFKHLEMLKIEVNFNWSQFQKTCFDVTKNVLFKYYLVFVENKRSLWRKVLNISQMEVHQTHSSVLPFHQNSICNANSFFSRTSS